MHISEVIVTIGNTASILAKVEFPDDDFHKNITNTAKQLIKAGRADYRYVTQYTTGSCVWKPPSKRILVTSTHTPEEQ